MVETVTAHYSWTKPEVTKSASTWGGFINNDLDAIDAQVFANQGLLANYLPLAGGAITGDLTVYGTAHFSNIMTASITAGGNISASGNVTSSATVQGAVVNSTGSITASGTVTANGAVNAGSGGFNTSGPIFAGSISTSGAGSFHNGVTLQQTAPGDISYQVLNSAGTTVGSFGNSGNAIGIFTPYGNAQFFIETITGNFWYANGSGTALKIGGGSWATISDARIKTVDGDYELGLDDVLKLRPVRYRYKGNAALDADRRFVGLVAQEVETVFPDMVSKVAGSIDGRAVSDLRQLDISNLVFALVNSVRELAAEVAALKARTP